MPLEGWTTRRIEEATGGTWRPAGGAGACLDDLCVRGFSIDSRSIGAGELFFAVRGEHRDGHDFVRDAFARGAAAAVVEHEVDAPGPTLLVADTVTALQRLASAWRTQLAAQGCTVIAVAGSNGKTTTRHMIHGLLAGAPAARAKAPGGRLHGTQAPGSFNNHLGVPLTLLRASAGDDFVVAEIGTNHPGEIAALGAIARPDVAVIVSIGREHLEFFGDVDAVAREQASLLRYVRAGGLVLVCDDRRLERHLPPPAALAPRVTVARIEVQEDLVRDLPWPGAHARHDAAAAAQVALWLGVAREQVRAALRTLRPVRGRFDVRRLDSVTVIDDAYNANPDSLAAALTAVSERWADARRRAIVLGDMLELGAQAPALHREAGQRIAETRPPFDLVVTIGELAQLAAEELQRARPGAEVHVFRAWNSALPERVAALLEPGDVVLLKASRRMALERLVPAIEARFAGAV